MDVFFALYRKGDLNLPQVARMEVHKCILISLSLTSFCEYVILSVHHTNLVKILYFAYIGLFCRIFKVTNVVKHLQL